MAKRKIKSTFLIDSDFWVVVKFIDDGLLSLLRLQEIENLERTEDGVEASLDEGGKCMAPYQGEWYEAKIIRKSEDKEDCLRTKKVFSEKAKADKKNKTETEGKKKNAKADKKNKTEKTEGKKKTEKKKKEVTKKIEKKNKVEEVDETKKKKKDMLQEKKEKEISRKQTLHSAEDYILNNLICSSTSTNINSFQPPYFTMPPFNYIPPPISSSSNSIALTSSLGSAPFNSMSRSYPLTSSLGSAPFNSMSHSIPLTSSLGSAPFNSMSRSIPLTSSLGSAPFNSMSCSIPLTSSLGSAPFNSLSHSIPLTSSLGSAPFNSLYNSIPLTSSLGSEPFNSLSNSIPLTSSLGSAPFNSLSHSVPITSSLGSAPFNSLSNSIPITSSLGSAPFNSLSNSIPITSSLGSAPFNSLSNSIPTAVSSAISLNNFSATPFSPISLDRSTFRLGSCDMPPSSFCSTPIPPRCLFPSNSSCTTSPYTSLLTDSHLSSLDTCSAYQVPSSTPLNSSSLQQNRPSKTWTISKPVDSLTHSPHTDLSTTSSILSNSFSVLNTEIQVNDTSSFSCKSCLVHENQIQSLKTALSQAREDSCRLHQRIRELEAMQNNNALVSSTDEQTDEVIDHYTPLRGVKVDYSNYVIISSEDNLPNGYERITDCSDVAVPRKWLIQILGVCKGKSSSYCVKKFIDGFFEPEEFIHLSASKAVATMPVMKAIRLYAINKLRMRDAEFMSALNSKIGTFKRSVKMERRIVKSLNI